MVAGLIVTSLIAAVALAAAAWLWAGRAAAWRERDAVAADRAHLEEANASHLAKLDEQASRLAEQQTQVQLAEQRTQQAADQLEQQRHQADARLNELREQFAKRETELREHFEQAQKQSRETFDALASKALKGSTDEFLKLAKQVFEAEQNKNREAVQGLIKPVNEKLELYQKAIAEAEKARKEAFGSLSEQARALAEDQRRLRDETARLVRALRRPEVRGRWGEMQLKRVAEMAGMIEYVDFVEQESIDTECGRQRPDMIVRLPSDRQIVIDAKAPLDAFIQSLECEDDASRADCLRRHAEQLDNQVRLLAGKAYHQQFDRTPDFVVLFIPGESFLQAAVQERPNLLEQAMDRGVVIATPSTLISLLRAVAIGWREQALAENARQIAELGRELHERLAVVLEHVAKLGGRIDSAVKQYNTLVGSVDARLLPSARKFVELKADSPRAVPETIDPLQTAVRDAQGLIESTPAGAE